MPASVLAHPLDLQETQVANSAEAPVVRQEIDRARKSA